MRVDEALRIYLSEFRLPGEAPLISALLEHFAAHWRVGPSSLRIVHAQLPRSLGV